MRSISLLFASTVITIVTSCSDNARTSAGADVGPTSAASTPVATAAPLPTADSGRFVVPIDGLPVIGASDALVTIVAFTDYDCAFCARAEHTLKKLRDKYGRDLRIVVAQHPLPMHPHAREAALTAIAAEGPAFEDVHRLLFENPERRSEAELRDLVSAAGINATAFARARASESPSRALAHAENLAKDLRVRGTPTFFVNGRKIGGAQPFDTFDAVIAGEMTHARDLVATGIARDRIYDATLREARARPAAFDAEDDAEAAWVPASKGIGGAHLAGSSDATTTLVVFTDFECPYCKRLDANLRTLTQRHPEMKVVLRNHPLPMHAHARLAAKAALAADAQGKLEAFSATMFARQDALDRASLEAYARELGLDVSRFSRDLDSSETAARLAEDDALATKLDVQGTPTTFVEGRRIVGAQPIPLFEETARRPTPTP